MPSKLEVGGKALEVGPLVEEFFFAAFLTCFHFDRTAEVGVWLLTLPHLDEQGPAVPL